MSYVTPKILHFGVNKSTISFIISGFGTMLRKFILSLILIFKLLCFLSVYVYFHFHIQINLELNLGVICGYNYMFIHPSSTNLSFVGQLYQFNILNILSFSNRFKICIWHSQFAFELHSAFGHCIMPQWTI